MWVLTPDAKRNTPVTFQLTEVSQHPGIAMNFPVSGADTTADIDFATTSVPKVPSKGTKAVSVTLNIRDYAAQGKVAISYKTTSGTTRTFHKQIPLDANANELPDVGWNALANSATGAMNHVSDAHPPNSDTDNDPVVTGLPTQGMTGDGLTAFEEYRGFLVRGAHRRLHPLRKDLFIVIDPADDSFDDRITELPLAVHEIRPSEALGQFGPEINPNRGTIAGSSLQRALFARNRLIPPMYQRADGVVSADFEARGWTFQQGDDLNLIDGTMASLALVQSPNETLVCETFDYNFWRHYVSYGPNGLRETAIAPTDIDFPANRAIYGGDDWTQSIPNSLNALGDDFQTDAILTVCGSEPDRPWRALSPEEVIQLYQNTFLHEVAHGVDIEHDRVNCSLSIMSDEAALPVVRELTPNDQSQIRVHRKHN